MASRALRVAFKRTYSLHLDDIVRIEFSDFPLEENVIIPTTAVYQIIKLDHDQRYTTAVLSLAQQDETFDSTLQSWLSERGAQRQLDIDDQLINLQSQFYQRVWLSRLSLPILWLGSDNVTQPLLAMHMMPAAAEIFGPSIYPHILERLPFMQLVGSSQDVIAVIGADNSYSCLLSQHTSVKKLINWHLEQDSSHLLWLQTKKTRLDKDDIAAEIAVIRERDGDYAQHLETKLKAIRSHVTVLDLTNSFSNTKAREAVNHSTLSGLQILKNPLNETLPPPGSLKEHIQRDLSRFYIRTPIILHIGDEQLQLETLDVSAEGMSLNVPADIPILPNQRISIDFTRWQTLTKKVKLQNIPYQVKNKQLWNKQLKLGLQRVKNNCPESLNDFFQWVIAQNQDKLKTDHNDVIQAAESRLFSSKLSPDLTSAPVFLGMNPQGYRDISLVGKTTSNAVEDTDSGLWFAIRPELRRISDMLKALNHDQITLETTIYTYRNSQGQWSLAFEQDFNHSRDKTLFIQRGLAAEAFTVHHCVLQCLSGNEAHIESDLSAQLLQLRQQRPHKVQELRQQFSSLFGLMELTDITSVISLFYSAD